MNFSEDFIKNISEVINNLDYNLIDKFANVLSLIKQKNGRLFMIGLGGSCASASHAVNDFRKLCGIQTFSPLDNISEITARINDDGWENSIVTWLECSHFSQNDMLFVLSVGGGNEKKNISMPIVNAIKFANNIQAWVFSIVGKNDGYAYEHSDMSILIPVLLPEFITPYSESIQSVILHLLASHPLLKENLTKWEEIEQSNIS
jgi:D-sedoheptulose 7-phosphate isomerase